MKTLERPGLQAEMDKKPETIKESYKGSDKLKSKVAIITGGDSGIGRSVAVHFAREGANVVIAYLSEDKDAEKTKELIENEGGECLLLSGDLRDNSYCQSIIDKTIDKFGQIDILVNNAATQYPNEDLTKITFEDLKETFDVNIVSMIYLTKLALEHMKEGARIINTTSVTGYEGNEMMVDYSSTKGAITSFTRALSGQLASKKILVNGVAPGPVLTPLIPATMKDLDMDLDEFGKSVPLGRPGQPSELGPAYVFLASADSSYITGQIIHINGGTVIGG